MNCFHAKLLFDGEQWIQSTYFQVDAEGIFHNVLPEQVAQTKWQELGVVIPGFMNCHSHSFQRAMAGLGERRCVDQEQDSFWTWREQMYHLVQSLNPVSFKIIADWLYVEMLEAGYTSVGEFHYLHKQANGQAYDNPVEMALRLYESGLETGIRVSMLPVLYQYGGIGQPAQPRQRPFIMDSLEQYQQYHQQLHSKVPKGYQLGASAHSIRAVEKQVLREFAAEFGWRGIPVHIHIAEQPAEVVDAMMFYGKRPVEFLFDIADINNNWSLIHATHITSEETQLIAHSGAVVGICPLTEANLGDGIFPMKDYLAHNGSIAIGSDSHIRIDPFEELRLIEYTQRYQLNARSCLADAHCLSPGLKLATECYKGGERSLKLQAGLLKEGCYADFLVLREDHPAMLRLDPQTLWDEMIFAAGRELIQDVYTGGKQVVTAGKHLLHDQKLSALKSFYQQV